DDGTWSCTPDTALTDGDHTLTATQTDEAGNTSAASDPVRITVDTTAPDAPVITAPTDDTDTNDNAPTIEGTGEAGDTVAVTDENGDTVCETTVADDGTWSCTPDTALTDGDHTLTATQTDEAGNTSPESEPVHVTVDTQAPDAPVITGPVNGAVLSDTTPTITGTGEPGASVTVTEDGDTVCTATVGADGTWSCAPDDALGDGEHTLTATQTDEAGNTSPVSEPVTFTVDSQAPPAPVIEAPTNNSSTNDTTPTISGTGEPGDIVTVTDQDGHQLGITEVGTDGSWSLDSTELAEGTYTISALQTDAAGNDSATSDPVIFTVDTTAPDAPAITGPKDGSEVNDSTPTISGTGEAGDTVTVTDENGTTVCTATVQADGTWSCTPDTALTDGDHTLTATQTDPAGNESPASDPVHITVDTQAPAAPAITSPSDGDTIADNTPSVSGTGEPGDTVTVTDEDGDTVCTATVKADGSWSCTPDTALTDGDHTLTATQTDSAGNTSPTSDPVKVSVDSHIGTPTITGPEDGATVTDRTPTVTGTGDPGATVTVRVDGTVVGTATVGSGGRWSLALTDRLAYGDHSVRAVQRDAAGNVSPAATSRFAVAPAAPTITSPSDGDAVEGTDLAVKGMGRPGAQITVYADGQAVASTTVGKGGKWGVDAAVAGCGKHTLTATQGVDTASARVARPKVHGRAVTSATSAPVAVTVTCPASDATTGDPGSTLPNTGAPAGLAALLGLGLGCVATGVLLLARRRRA
ncbi:Ig-like domain-containing protein, partial [Nocardioides sp. DS6]